MNNSAVIKRDDELTVVPSTSTTKTTKKTPRRRRRKTKSVFDKLNDDVLMEILIKLSIECLHRYKSVCKRWHILISEPSFVHRYIQLRPNYLSRHDHFIINHTSSTRNFGLQIYDELNEFTSIHNKLDFSFKFLPIVRDHRIRDFKILATSHGLLLCKAEYTNKYDSYFVVCNPLTKKCLNFPVLDYWDCYLVPRAGFMCYPLNPLDYRVSFTIIIVQCKSYNDQQDYFNTHVFSSETGRWAIHVVACPPSLHWSSYNIHYVVCNGMFHWFTASGIVAYDPLIQPQKCKLIGLPSPIILSNRTSPTVFGASEGHIRFGVSSPNSDFFDVWELEDYEKELWCFKYHVQRQGFCQNWMFSPSNGDIIYFTNLTPSKLVMCNMKLGSMAEKPWNTLVVWAPIPFVRTPWPTPVPHLPYEGSSSFKVPTER